MDMPFFNKWAPRWMRLLQADFDLGTKDAAAVVGNIVVDSDGNSIKWTGERQERFAAYCARDELDPADMMTNYEFLSALLKGPDGAVLEIVKTSGGQDQKVTAFCEGFFGPGAGKIEERLMWACQAIAAWAAQIPADHEAAILLPPPKPYALPALAPEAFWPELEEMLVRFGLPAGEPSPAATE